MDIKNIWDISPLISEKTAVWPGDQNFSRAISLDTKKGDHLTLSSISTTVHIGAHADAPNHYHKDGEGIDQCDLNKYIGMCQVIECQIDPHQSIQIKDLKNKAITKQKVLLKTMSFPDQEKFNTDFNSLSSELIHFLNDKNVHLVGIDTPSVDPFSSKTLDAHLALFETKISVLEGLDLGQIIEGEYFLSALPLKLKNADASPLRAILIDFEKV